MAKVTEAVVLNRNLIKRQGLGDRLNRVSHKLNTAEYDIDTHYDTLVKGASSEAVGRNKRMNRFTLSVSRIMESLGLIDE